MLQKLCEVKCVNFPWQDIHPGGGMDFVYGCVNRYDFKAHPSNRVCKSKQKVQKVHLCNNVRVNIRKFITENVFFSILPEPPPNH